MAHRFVFLMDPLEGIDIDADSTFALMLASQEKGDEVLYAHPRDLGLQGRDPFVLARSVSLRRKNGDHFEFESERAQVQLNDVDAVFMRRDPPYDLDYVLATYTLDLVSEQVVMVNSPRALRDCNEKVYALHFAELMPKTMVTADRASLRAFISREGGAVLKPLFGAGGYGILHLLPGDKNIGSALDILTREGTTPIEAQAFVKEVAEGDRRVILLNGEPIGVINRRPSDQDIRANMHVGGVAEPAQLTARDREICARIKPDLVRRGLVFVGIDIIGDVITEINVTSPTGLQELARFDGTDPAGEIVEWVHSERARRLQSG